MHQKPLKLASLFLLVGLTLTSPVLAKEARQSDVLPASGNAPKAFTLSAYSNPIAMLSPLPLLSIQSYRMAPGDTLTNIARDHGISVDTILSYNRILSPRYLRAGQELNLPNTDGYLIAIPTPTPVALVAARYRIRPDSLVFANLNNLKDGMVSGDVFLPGAVLEPAELRLAMGDVLCWPTINARISSRFGKREDPVTGAPSNHKGMDIAARYGAPVFAALDGVVTETGRDELLGKYIKISHGNGVRTTYGHLSLIQIKQGQKVSRGQAIGKVGSTGYSTGPHLHFVVYRNNKLVNPLLMTN